VELSIRYTLIQSFRIYWVRALLYAGNPTGYYSRASRTYGRLGPAKPPLREFGADPVSGKNVVAKKSTTVAE